MSSANCASFSGIKSAMLWYVSSHWKGVVGLGFYNLLDRYIVELIVRLSIDHIIIHTDVMYHVSDNCG